MPPYLIVNDDVYRLMVVLGVQPCLSIYTRVPENAVVAVETPKYGIVPSACRNVEAVARILHEIGRERRMIEQARTENCWIWETPLIEYIGIPQKANGVARIASSKISVIENHCAAPTAQGS